MAITLTAPTTASIVGTATSDDYLLGTAADDTITGGEDADTLTGGLQIDYVADGVDTMEGGLGNDWYVVNNTADVVIENAGEGIDAIATSVSYTLGNNLEWIVAKGAANIAMTGNSGDNILDATQNTDAALDSLAGGGGNDIYMIDSNDKITAETGGTDTVITGTAFSIDLTAASIYFATSVYKSIENVTLGGTGAADIAGNDLNNRLTGNSGANVISGGKGNDILDSGEGSGAPGSKDSLSGGDGNDTYIIRATSTTSIDDSSGTDKIFSFADVTGSVGIENITLLGAGDIKIDVTDDSSIAHMLIGNTGANTITGSAKNDTLNGGGGDDTLEGGAGSDTYIAGLGDVIDDESGTDTASVSGEGTITTTDIETITVTGTDNTNVDASASTVNVKITGNADNNDLEGGDGKDSISGADGDDALTGNAGNDTLVGGTGTNSYDGGAGDDIYVVTSAADTFATTDAGKDTIQFSGDDGDTLGGSTAIDAAIEKVTLTGGSNINVTYDDANTVNVTMTGNSGDNILTSGAGADSLNGGSGDDELIGNGGKDTLNGSTGNDIMTGGAGDDYYYVDSSGDDVTGEDTVAGSGIDTIETIVTWNLSTTDKGENVEKLKLAGSLAINGTGNDLDNTLSGNSGNNKLTGNAGNDTIDGGSGNDTITGNAGQDTVTVGSGNDKVVK